jgi:hypothetical protein
MGGLGNQLFQIFATIVYGMKSQNKFQFLELESLGSGSTTIRPTYWNSIFSKLKSNLKSFLIKELPQPLHIMGENDFTFNELNINEMINKNVLLFGYFQSYKYFEEYYDVIYRMLGLEKMKNQVLENIGIQKNNLKNCISMHFRIGDYKKIQHVHPLATQNYYQKALKFIQEKNPDTPYTIYYFCEDQDIEDVLPIIRELSLFYSLYRFEKGTNQLSDWEQLLFMSCCNHNIIANSTFSWWAAYFNSWEDKIVCYPSVWFGPSANHNTKDLCPDSWNKISV